MIVVEFGLRGFWVIPLFDDNGCSAGHRHQDGVAFAHAFVVEVNADDGICTKLFCIFLEFLQGVFTRFFQYFFIASCASAEEVANLCSQVAECVSADDGF